MIRVYIPRRAAQTVFDVYATAQFAKYDLIDKMKARKARKEQKAYDAMIAESQAKIGPYVPTTCPVQIWA